MNKKPLLLSLACSIGVAASCALIYVLIKPSSAETIFSSNKESIVELKCQSDVLESYGTAVFIQDDILISNAHVVCFSLGEEKHTFSSYSIRFCYEEEYTQVKLLSYDEEKDIAILKSEEDKGKAIQKGSSEVDYGQKVYAIGNSLNYGLSITQGIVSNPMLEVEYEGIIQKVIQCNLTIQRGNSGGALLDEKGRCIGITTFRLKDQGETIQNLSYSIPLDLVFEVLQSEK